MQESRLGIIHPGAMGVSVGATAVDSGYEVCWASEGRSMETQDRAAQYGFNDLKTLAALCEACGILVSVCPPHAAEQVAQEVIGHGFAGLFVDANAISPQRARSIGDQLAASGANFVDGGIIGGPAWEPGATTLYLSGRDAIQVSVCFAAGPLDTALLGHVIGQASALKMCYAAWTKGRTALLCAILAAAEKLDVWEPLAEQWERDWPGFPEEAVQRARRVTAKAWRFSGEMEEIAATFSETGLPGGFHLAAADLYRRIGDFKDLPTTPDLETVIAALLSTPPDDR